MGIKLAGRNQLFAGRLFFHSLDTLPIDLMQYTCECHSFDDWMAREGSHRAFHGRNVIDLGLGAQVGTQWPVHVADRGELDLD